MSETPICDKHKYETDLGAEVVPLEIAQKLERMLKNAEKAAETYRLEAQKAKHEQSAEMLKSERAANAMLTEELERARANIEQLKQLWSCNLDIIGGELNKQLVEARAEIQRKDKSIEQMQTAFKEILKIQRTVDLNLFDIEQVHSIAEAALSAAERGA